MKELMKEWLRGCVAALLLLTTSVKKLDAKEMVRRLLYFRFGVIASIVVISGLGGCVLLKMPQTLSASLAAVIIYVLYIGYIERLDMNGLLFYIKVRCTGSKKVLKAVRKTLYLYHFQGIGDDADVSFSLNRTEELGFVEEIPYLFCFRRTTDGQIDNTNLIYYVEWSQFNEPVDLPNDKAESQEGNVLSDKTSAAVIEFADDEEEG
ncbi:hypothetical protein [Candidatus Allofournierella merdipullorum]|uniref:hypothetical protein n=1 Tax=Candidatus Allofournierella merdipullorum TaxID=2838595 RepID=UPI00374F1167